MEAFYGEYYFPHNKDKHLIFVYQGEVKKFDGITIPNVCFIEYFRCPKGFIATCKGVKAYCFSERILKSSPDWKQLGMMMPDYKLADIKKIIRSAFPKYALKFDKIIDADDWTEVEWEVGIPRITIQNVFGVDRSKTLADGRKLAIGFNAVRYGGVDGVFSVPFITRPIGALILSVKYQPNGGKNGRMFLTVIVPPKTYIPKKFPPPPKTPPMSKEHSG